MFKKLSIEKMKQYIIVMYMQKPTHYSIVIASVCLSVYLFVSPYT